MVARENAAPQYSLALDLSEVCAVDRFVSREKELAQLRDILDGAPTRRTAILQGLGGMGKTQLAIAYVQRSYSNYSATIWLNARDETTLMRSFAQVAGRILRQNPTNASMLDVVGGTDPSRSVDAVTRWLDEPKNNNWLLIYDNYDEPRLDSYNDDSHNARNFRTEKSATEGTILPTSRAYDIRRFLPSSYHGAIIITTRSSSLTIIGRLVQVVKFENVNDSLEVLASTSHRHNLTQGERCY